MGAKKSPTSLLPNKKNPNRVPKRIHKAEREKMKRELLNELFLQLADALELTEQNSGKASILGETTRFVKLMLDHIKCLKKENADLLSESQYVTVEKNELQDETSALQIQIRELKSVTKDRTVQKNLDLNAPPIESQEPQLPPYFEEDSRKLPASDPLFQQAPALNPAYVVPVPACPNFQVGPDPDSGVVTGNMPTSNVSKPHPRYPTPSDSWPFQLLEKQSRAVRNELQCDSKV